MDTSGISQVDNFSDQSFSSCCVQFRGQTWDKYHGCSRESIMHLNPFLFVQSSTYYFALFIKQQLTFLWEHSLGHTLGPHP